MTQFKTTGMLCLLAATFTPSVRADGHFKESRLTIDKPVQVENVVLAPGDYIFKLTWPDSNQTIVTIYDGDGSRVRAIVAGVAAYRQHIGDKTRFTFSQPKANQPSALKSWFYPDDNFGVEFPVKN